MLFVTGYVGEGESDDLRGHELLRKPFTVGALASAVAAALARSASEPPPRRSASRGRRLSAASSGWRCCQGVRRMSVPAWRLIFQAI